jgi:hypothetical protein
MKRTRAAFTLRWLLPLAQLLVWLVVVSPVRWFIFFEVYRSTRPLRSADGRIQLNQADLDAIERASDLRDRLMKVPMVLNFPALLVEAPYTLTVYTRTGHPIGGTLLETWRAIGWPLVGIPFWWCVGRPMEALRAARRSIVLPRITLAETIFGIMAACIGVASLVGILTSLPDDRHFDFLMFVCGGLLWGILGAVTMTARVLQWRMLRRAAAVGQLA